MSLLNLRQRVNPVLVKEIRQAVRGKSFRGSFILALMIAAIVSAATLANLNPDVPQDLAASGTRMFFALHLVFVFSAIIAVPVQAHRSMASERDERTFDALVISGLKPAQIVLGKWLAAGATLGLFLAAMLPFFAAAATLYGLDLLMAFLFTCLAMAVGLVLSMLGLLAASIGKSKALSSMLYMVFLGACGLSMMFLIQMTSMTVFGFGGGFGSTDEFLIAMAILLTSAFFLLTWLHGVTVASISHPEENGMLRVRWAALACAVFLGSVPIWTLSISPVVPARALFAVLTACLVVLGILNMPVLSESPRMRVRCHYELLRGRWGRFGSWLFLPGGGSAYVLFLVQVAILTIPTVWKVASMASSSSSSSGTFQYLLDNGLGGYFTMLGIVLTSAGLPCFLAARARTDMTRHVLRFVAVTLPAWIVLIIGLFTLLSGMNDALFRSPVNPFWALEENFPDVDSFPAMFFWIFLGLGGAVPMLLLATGQWREIARIRRGAQEA